MRVSYILFLATFVSISIRTCQSEAMTITAIGLVSSIVYLAEFIWNNIPQGESTTKILNKFESSQQEMLLSISEMLQQATNNLKFELIWKNIDERINVIHNQYEEMVKCNATLINKNGTCRIFDDFKDDKDSQSYVDTAKYYMDIDPNRPRGLIKAAIHSFAFGPTNIPRNILSFFQNYPQDKILTIGCSGNSFQKLVDEYRQAVQIAEVEYLLTLRIINEIIRAKTNDAISKMVSTWVDEVYADLDKQHVQMMEEFAKSTNSLSRDVWRCDPAENIGHVEDKTYMKLNYVFQGYIENQFYLLPNSLITDCTSTEDKDFCGVVDPVSPHSKERWSRGKNEKVCSGDLWNCKKRFYNDGSLWDNHVLKYCPAEEKSDRRYEFAYVKNLYSRIKPINHRYISEKNHCDRSEYSERDNVPRFCNICYCVCADKYSYKDYNSTGRLSDRAFLVKSASYSDKFDNYVVTGARLRKKYGVIYIQLQQGKLMSNGKIDSSTVHWKEQYDNNYAFDSKFLVHITWNRLKSIQMEDIDLPTGNVLTGLSFDVTTLGRESRLRLKAHGSEFDFSKGIVSNYTVDYSGKNIDFTKKNEFQVHEKLLPTKHSNNKVITDKNISFDISDLQTDLGQNTIPFIDIQDVTTNTSTAMGGAGLYYKCLDENSTHSGYIGLKLKTYDFVPHIKLNKNIVSSKK